jgi:sulfite dehydrogenase (cytochrome) subunit B
MTTTRVAIAVLLAAGLPLAAGAQTRSITLPPDHPYGDLKAGPGKDATERACRSCHSTDYVVRQPRGDVKQWEGVVTKMINVYGANIGADEAKAIAQYLATQYGK